MVCIVSAIRILPICTVALFSLSHLNYIDALLLPFRSSVNQSVGAKHLESDINIRKSYLALNSLPSSDVDKNSKSDKESVCPFSMKYPRYRVPLSAGKEDYSAKGGNIFSGIRISLDKAAVSRKYATDVKMNNYCIVEPQIDVSEDTDRIAKGKVGIFVTSLIWRKVAELIEDHVSGRSSRSVISIPNASVVSLVQISDIINWHNKQQAEKTVNSAPVEIEACVDKEAAVPTVVLTAFEGSGEPCVKANEQTTEQIIDGTKSWVLRVLVKLGICPFTKSVTKSGQGLQDAGIPVGNIAYHHSNAGLNEIPHLMADTWDAIFNMIQTGDSGRNGISSILLANPEFDYDFPLWAGPVFAMLEAGVVAAKAEPLIGVVCFHPQYKSPNGQSWPGFGHMHSVPRLRKWLNGENEDLSNLLDDEEVAAGGSYQRRTPHATINVLRAEQLEAAEGRRSTANLYARNIGVLHEYGFDQLEKEIALDKSS